MRANSQDARLQHATEIAHANIDQFIAAMRSDDLDLHGFTILTSRTYPDGRDAELWIGPTAYDENTRTFTGIVDNAPDDLQSVSIGDTVTVARSDVSDWMYLDDEKLVGGWALRVRIDFADPDQRDLMMQRFNLTERDLELPPVPEFQDDPQQTNGAQQP